MSKRDLYPSSSKKNKYDDKVIHRRMNILAYSDGKKNIFEISKIINESLKDVILEIEFLKKINLIYFDKN